MNQTPHDVTRTYHCPAKVNLALSVGAPRPDGFHPIGTWMVALSLYDDLRITPLGPGEASSFEIVWAEDAPQPSPIDWPLEKDLAVRAHGMVEAKAGRPLPVRARLSKRIPVGGGLAGGSSDGAVMLRAMNELFHLELSREDLLAMACGLGSDPAFFLGGGSAIATGRGEQLTDVPLLSPLDLVLVLPDFGCPTGQVYRAFDALTPEAEVDESRVWELTRSQPIPVDGPFNDLAEAACRVAPRLGELRQRCVAAVERPVHVTGSGAAMFVLADSPVQAEAMAQRLREQVGLTCRAARSVGGNTADRGPAA